jgi:hypothetical protein
MNKIIIVSIAAHTICAAAPFSVRGREKRARGKPAVVGAETVSATLLAAAAVVAGFGVKLQVKPAGGLLQESCTLPPAFPTAFKTSW